MGRITVGANTPSGIGKWTATRQDRPGRVFHREGFENADGTWTPARDYMYVQFTVTGTIKGFQGTPVGLSAESTGIGEIIVHGDQSEAIGNTVVGVLVSDSTTTITTAYYGWIQLATPHTILHSVVCTTGLSANSLVNWVADQYLEASGTFDSNTETYPMGWVMSGEGGTAVCPEDSLSTFTRWHVYVLGTNPAI